MQFILWSQQTTVMVLMLELSLISIALLIVIIICDMRKKFSPIKNLLVNRNEIPFSKSITEKVSVNYPIKHIQIALRKKFYKKLKIKNPEIYRKIPENGFIFNVEYADTKYSNDNNETEIIVLALHGAPGSHHDFASLIQHLSKTARVIVPNFPDYSATIKTEVFRHSAEEKAAYIKEFLNNIKIHKIDMLLSHSSAIYTSVLLWLDNECPPINSFVFFNPGGHRRIQAMKPRWYIEGSVRIYQNKFVRTLFRTFGTAFLNITHLVKANTDDIEALVLSASTVMYSGFRQLEEKLEKLGHSKIPILFVFSENDRLIEKQIFYEMADILGANQYNIAKYDQNGILEKQCFYTIGSRATDNLKVVVFECGGHYAFINYPKQINEACDQLLRTSLKQSLLLSPKQTMKS